MDKLNQITSKYSHIPMMNHKRALKMREIILHHKCKKLCELGHYQGKSSAYIGAILEEQGFGHLTTYDIADTAAFKPNINDFLAEFSLNNFVSSVVSQEGFVWDLTERLKSDHEKFDFCYIDSGHTYESTLIAFVLIDLLLEPGGIIVFDDVSWSVKGAIENYGLSPLNIPMYKFTTKMQMDVQQVRMVCDIIVPTRNYNLLYNLEDLDWLVYQKL